MTEPLQLMEGGVVPANIGSVSKVKLLELLGVGAFGCVWKVQDLITNKLYALKVVQDITPGSVMCERVRMEAEVNISSPYIVPSLGLRQWDSTTYLILFEFYQGMPLTDWIASGKLNENQKRMIFQQLLWGVRDAHRLNIIHRDLKPENVLVNDRYEVKIIDFGISKFHEVDLTRPGDYMGTLLYMPPEAFIEGSKLADARTDIYALGHILYELEMGEHFWERQGWTRIGHFAAYLSETPLPVTAIDFDGFKGSCYTQSKVVIAEMVTIDVDQRITSVDAVLDLLSIRDILPAEYEEQIALGFPLLRVESGTNKDACLPLNLSDGEFEVLGRGEIAGNDTSISRHHLEIRRQKMKYQIRDVGSTNGTLYCGNLLVADGRYVTLSHGDRLKLGDVFLRVEFSEVG